MKAGIQIRKGSLSGGRCTMAFHVSSGTDEQMLTAGHCGYGGSNNWYHDGYGPNSFGAELATWYVHNGVDAMKVGLPDAHASNLVFGMSGSVIGTFYPAVGETHCWSLGVTYFVDCGTITVAYGSWTSDLCNCTNWGSRASGVTTIDGDSGSPITLGSGKTAAYATGIHNGNFSDGTVAFARVKQVLLHWNLTLPCGSPC